MKKQYYVFGILAIACVTILLFFTLGCEEPANATSEQPPSVTNDTSVKTPVDYNTLYQGIIDDYRKLIDLRLSPNFEEVYNSNQSGTVLDVWYDYIWAENASDPYLEELQYHWHCMLADMLDYLPTPTIDSFGYIQTDLNGDDIPELVWVSESYGIFCIFTVSSGRVRLVDAFFPKYKCVILENGDLYTMSVGGAEDYIYTVSKISDSDSSLITQKEFGKEYGDYYEKVNETRRLMNKDEFEEICSNLPFQTSDTFKKNTIHLLQDSNDIS